jgi:DNA repair protein RadC
MKDLPNSERPYEKLEMHGADNLSDAELLAIIIKTGTKKETSVALAQRVLMKNEGIKNIIDVSLEQLKEIKGIGRVKAIQIKASLEIAKRITNYKKTNVIQIKSPSDVSKLLMEEMRFLKKEYVKALLLDTKNQLIKIVDVSIGGLNSSVIHPREVFCEAIKCSCASLLLVHNHPSGDPTPSNEDITATKRIFETSKIVGIELLDHIVIGDKNYISMKEKSIF